MIITLTTDFGLKDPFVGAMKGVILGLAGSVKIVDITHEIPSYDIIEASIVIREASRFFPSGTIHIVVVDPGVGGARRPIGFKGNKSSPSSGPSTRWLSGHLLPPGEGSRDQI